MAELRGAKANREWERFYRESPLREAAIRWFPFPDKAHILEVGCGYGALTGLLCVKAESVDAIDRDPVCVQSTQQRWKDADNLHVICKDIMDYSPEETYDIIVVIEFLESFRHDEEELFEHLQSMLSEGGIVLVGFRNRYGIKYQCGACDEYVLKPGDACKETSGLHTKEQVEKLLKKVGLTELQWYYPLPDFGFTQLVCSDRWMPQDSIRDRVICYDAFGEDSSCARREYDSYDELIRNGMLSRTANVMMVAASADGLCLKADGAVLTCDREPEHAFITGICSDGTVTKEACFPEGEATLKQLADNLRKLSERGISTVPAHLETVPGKEGERPKIRLVMPRIEEKPLLVRLRRMMDAEPQKITEIFDMLHGDIQSSSPLTDESVLEEGYPDMIPCNAFFKDGRIMYYDQEFRVSSCPVGYVMYRALHYTWIHIPELEQVVPLREMKRRYDLGERWEEYERREEAFIARNRGSAGDSISRWAWGEKPYSIGLIMGVFDLFHAGHVNLIRRAKQRCRYLRVGVLSDDLVRLYKKRSPVIPQEDRMEVLRSVSLVDEIVLIDGEYVSKVEEWHKRPYECFFSGDDYAGDPFWEEERKQLRELGAEMEFFPYTRHISSTMIREQLEENDDTEQ